MIAAIIQPGFLPWLGFFEQMARADVFIYLDDVPYTRKDWRNRNRLKSPDGPKTVSVPVHKTERNQTPICQARVNNEHPWRAALLNQIEQWYRKAPYFDVLFPKLQAIMGAPYEWLVDLDTDLVDWLRGELDIRVPIYKSSDIPDKSSDKNMKIIDILKHHNADVLYDGKSARNFIDQALFAQRGLTVVFQDYQHPEYPQLWGPFVSHLSTLDLLMNCGPDSRDILLSSPDSPVLVKG